MTSPLVLHAAPAAGVDEPFEMLAACHERVARMLRLLERLQAHLAGPGADEQAQQAARDVMRYFDQAAPNHHEDEERHVFPRLRERGLAELADRLHAQHEAMAASWAGVRADLVAVSAGRAPGDVAERWAAFATLYRAHIEAEDREAFPAAAAATDPPGLRSMADEMGRRRGLR